MKTTDARGRLGLREASHEREWPCLNAFAGATPHHTWAFLSWIAPLAGYRFVPLLVTQGDDVVGVAPLLVQQHVVYGSANFVPFQYLGPLVPPDLLLETAALLRRWAPRHGIANLKLSFHPLAAVPADGASGARMEELADLTYLLDLQHPSTDCLFERLGQDARGAVRRSARNGVSVREARPEELVEVLPALDAESYGVARPFVRRLGEALADRPGPVPMRCATAVVEGEVVGMSITLGGRIAIGWLGAVFRRHQRTAATNALYWDAMVWAHGQGAHWLDMLGAPSPGIAAFKMRFRPDALTHREWSWALPAYSWLRKGRVAWEGRRAPLLIDDKGGSRARAPRSR